VNFVNATFYRCIVLISYAQHREDVILHRALRHIEHGFYIDVGAYLPVEYSATKLFYDAGWSGINLEPCQRWFQELVAARPRDINLRIAASDSDGECEFHEVTDPGKGPHSTCVAATASQLRHYGMTYETYRVPTRRLAAICSEHAPGEIHFLKIDAEGAERQVLLGADFTRFRPWIIVIEGLDLQDVLVADSWEHILFDVDYRFGMAHAKNRFYWAAEHQELSTALSIPFDEYEPREASHERAVAQQQFHSLREHVAGLMQQAVQSSEEVTGLRRQIAGLGEQVTGLGQEVHGLREHATGLLEESDGLRAQVIGLREESDGLRAQVAGLRDESDGLREQVAALRKEAAGLEDRAIGLRAEIKAMRNSTSCRITAPLRTLGNQLRSVSSG
jgi:FkbM family methyltransferase